MPRLSCRAITLAGRRPRLRSAAEGVIAEDSLSATPVCQVEGRNGPFGALSRAEVGRQSVTDAKFSGPMRRLYGKPETHEGGRGSIANRAACS